MKLEGNKITADGSYEVPTLPGHRYAIIVAGDFGGGTVVPTIENSGQTFSIPIDGYDSLTADAAFEFLSPSNLISFTLTGATDPDIVIFTTPCAP